MRIIGHLGADHEAAPLDPGTPVLDVALGHGDALETVVWDAGFRYVRPLAARRRPDAELVVVVLVERPRGPEPERRPAARDADLVVGPDEVAEVRQRVAAYAVVVSDRGLLGTEYSATTNAVGAWGLPGGGLDAGEDPAAAVVREVHEETAQVVELGPLIAVLTSHWVGRAPNGRLEDFHAVRLVYRADCPHPSDPVVLDVGGTTSQARWVPLAELDSVAWTVGWQALLADVVGRD